MRARTAAAVLASIALAWPSAGRSRALWAQEDPVAWAAAVDADVVPSGSWSTLRISATIEAGWKIYSLTQARPPVATAIALGPDSLVYGRIPTQPAPAVRFDEAFGIDAEFFKRAVTFTVPFVVNPGAAPGRHDMVARVRYQACTDEVCLPPAEDTLRVALAVAPPGRGASPEVTPDEFHALAAGPVRIPDLSPSGAGAGEAAPVGDVARVRARGFGAFLVFAFLMGGLALLTPCVFPMIPITISYFTRLDQGGGGPRDRARTVRDAALHALGIVLAFCGLGMFMALVFGATGANRFAANPVVNLFVAGLLITFALDLLGIRELRLPAGVLSRVNAASGSGAGVGGLLLMGAVFAVMTFACTVPFTGTLLVAAAAGDWIWPLIGMLAFSSVFALPFFLLALFPRAVAMLPRSGSWLATVRVTLGFIELAAAFKFLSNADLVLRLGLLPRPVVIAAWIALAAVAALYLLGRIRFGTMDPGEGPVRIGGGRLLSGAGFLALAVFLVTGLFDRPLGELEAFLPPGDYPGRNGAVSLAGAASYGSGGTEQPWIRDYDEALATAAATGRPLFVDFTGYTCTNCRWMEANMFTRRDVQRLFEPYVLVRLYTDGRGERYERYRRMQLERFGTVAIPLYAVIDANGAAITTFPGMTRDIEKFSAFLRRGLDLAADRSGRT